ncbi:MAG: hypothetical protein WAU86_03415 [Oricola sp.]
MTVSNSWPEFIRPAAMCARPRGKPLGQARVANARLTVFFEIHADYHASKRFPATVVPTVAPFKARRTKDRSAAGATPAARFQKHLIDSGNRTAIPKSARRTNRQSTICSKRPRTSRGPERKEF